MASETPSSSLSLCVIARDEEADIGRCLASVRGFVPEIVVVDTGSSDQTVAIAESYGARVIRVTWTDDFAAARNRSLAEATGSAALVLDADEELATTDMAREHVEKALADEPTWGWQLRVRNLSPPGEMVEYTDVFMTRLLRLRPDVRYESRIHEQVAPSILRAGGRVGRLELTIVHHGYARKTAQGESRAARNVRALEALVVERPDDPYVHYQLGCTLQAAGRFDAAESSLQRARALGAVRLPHDVQSGLLLRLSQLALRRHADRDAVLLASESLALDADNSVALQVLAVACVGAGDVARGLDAFRLLRRRPELRPAFVSEVDRMMAALEKLALPSSPR
jgi:Glycosyl transferase family 2